MTRFCNTLHHVLKIDRLESQVMLTLNYLTFQFFDFERLCFYDYHWVDTSAGGLLVAEGIIRPIFSASALT
jgi:hypothetical protein